MNTSERIKKVLEYTDKGAIALATELGLSRTRLDGMIRKNVQAMPVVVADAISRKYTTISREWLLTGEGEMLSQNNHIDDNIKIIATPAEVEQQLLREEIKLMRQELKLMREEHSYMREELSLFRKLLAGRYDTSVNMVAEPDPIPQQKSDPDTTNL